MKILTSVTQPYLLLLWTPFHRWRNWSWDFHKIALLVNNKVQNDTRIFWFQIPHICSILCHPSALMEAVFKPKGTADAGTRLEASIQVGSIWGSQLIPKGDYLQVGQTLNPLKHWSPPRMSLRPPLLHSRVSSWFLWTGLEYKINATFNRPRSKEPASYGKLQFCLRNYNFWAVTWVLYLWQVRSTWRFCFVFQIVDGIQGITNIFLLFHCYKCLYPDKKDFIKRFLN